MNKLSNSNIPSHIAIIMDGNRRWARQRGLADIKGHEAGATALEKVGSWNWSGKFLFKPELWNIPGKRQQHMLKWQLKSCHR